MLLERPPEDVRVEEVLEVSGISTGSLGDRFADIVPDPMDQQAWLGLIETVISRVVLRDP